MNREVTDEEIDVFITKRKEQLAGYSDTAGDYELYPFVSNRYIHQQLIGDMSLEPWTTVRKVPRVDLFAHNPFELSDFRQDDNRNCFKMWDFICSTPSPRKWIQNITRISNMPHSRNESNRYWYDVLLPAMGMVGPIGEDNKILRPVDRYIFDLKTISDGWELLEAAHVLAHLNADVTHTGRWYAHERAPTQRQVWDKLAEIAVALTFNLPIDTGKRVPGMPCIPHYGLEIKSSNVFGNPCLQVPVSSLDAPPPDKTLAVVCTGVFIEPHPYGVMLGLDEYKLIDRWACMPSAVVIAGWELMDIISKQPLISVNPGNSKKPVHYGMRAGDLLPPDSLRVYLELARRTVHIGEVVCDKRHRLVREWLASDEYHQIMMGMPPLPCRQCLCINRRAEGAPQRPSGRPPKTLDRKDPKHDKWLRFDDALTLIHKIGTKAAVAFEGTTTFENRAQCILQRKQRKRNHQARLDDMKEDAWYKKMCIKHHKGKDLTIREEKRYKAYKQRRAQNK